MMKPPHWQADHYRGSVDALPRRRPTLEMERILMVDFTSTQAQAKELAPLVY
jgi:hypothetical protein